MKLQETKFTFVYNEIMLYCLKPIIFLNGDTILLIIRPRNIHFHISTSKPFLRFNS